MRSLTRLTHTSLIKGWILVYLLCVLCHAQTISLGGNSNVYVVKFFKATTDQLQSLNQTTNINKKLLTEVQFLQKLVRNTSGVLSQAVFYVNFSVGASPNFSKSANDNQILASSKISTASKISNTTQILKENNSTKAVQSLPTFVNNTNQALVAGNQIQQQGKISQSISISLPSNLSQNNTGKAIAANTPANLNMTSNKTNDLSPVVVQTNSNPYQNINSSILTIVSTNSNFTEKQESKNKKILNTDFPGISLYHQIPTNFIKNQLYRFSGIVANTSNLFSDTPETQGLYFNFVNVIFSHVKTNEEIKCIQKITKKSLEFQISCRLKIVGDFVLSIFAGPSGFSSSIIRKISQAPTSINILNTPAPQPDSLFLKIFDSDLFINWNSVAPLTKIVFSQNDISIQYILSNFPSRFRVPHCDFVNFEQAETKVTISHANSVDSTLSGISSFFGNRMQLKFNAVSHLHSNNQQDYFTVIPNIPQRLKVNQQFTLNLLFNTTVQNEVFTINPYRQIKRQYFFSEKLVPRDGIIKPNTNLTLVIKFKDEGSNLIQINQDTGLAIINQAVYVGDVYPLLPDYQDLKIQSLIEKTDTVSILAAYLSSSTPRQIKIEQPSKSSTVQQKRNFMLKLLNLLRTSEIIDPIYLDDKLTQIAQSHSDDMRKFNYFSHNNLMNEGPADRAKAFGFYGAIGQNIAQSDSLIEAHLSLQRSAAHFENSISKIWTRVGIGINQTLFGQYLITFQFSSRDIVRDPLSGSELNAHQKQLIAMFFRKFPNIKQENPQASRFTAEWMNGVRSVPLNQYLISKGITRQLTFTTIKFTYYPDFVSELQKTQNIFGDLSGYRQIAVGLGINRNNNTVMECYFVFIV